MIKLRKDQSTDRSKADLCWTEAPLYKLRFLDRQKSTLIVPNVGDDICLTVAPDVAIAGLDQATVGTTVAAAKRGLPLFKCRLEQRRRAKAVNTR